jgi:RNA polymerase sigma factor (sigma-70 family)
LTACLPSDASELELLVLAKAERFTPAGRDAAGRILELHHGLIVRLCERMLMDGYEIDDMLQEANMGGLEAIRYYDPAKLNPKTGRSYCFSTYLADCVRRRVFKWRNSDRQKPLPQEGHCGEDVDSPSPLLTAVGREQDTSAEQSEKLADVLEVLDDTAAKVVRLHHGLTIDKPMTFHQICVRLKIPAKKVEAIYNAAIIRLQAEAKDMAAMGE